MFIVKQFCIELSLLLCREERREDITNHADEATIWRESTARRKRSQAWRERRRYARTHTRQPREPVSHACPGPFGQRRGPGRDEHTPRETPPRPALWRHGAGGSGAPPFMEPVGNGAPPSPPATSLLSVGPAPHPRRFAIRAPQAESRDSECVIALVHHMGLPQKIALGSAQHNIPPTKGRSILSRVVQPVTSHLIAYVPTRTVHI